MTSPTSASSPPSGLGMLTATIRTARRVSEGSSGGGGRSSMIGSGGGGGGPVGDAIEGGTSSSSFSSRRRRSGASSVSGASMASLLARLQRQSMPQDLTLEGKVKVKTTIECGSDVLAIRFSPDGGSVAVGLRSGQVRLYTAIGHLTQTLQYPAASSSLSIDQDGFAFGSNRPADTSSTLSSSSLSSFTCHSGGALAPVHSPVTSVLWLPGSAHEHLVATHADGRLVAWRERQLGSVTALGEESVDVKAAALHGVEDKFISYTPANLVLRDATTHRVVLQCDMGRGGHLLAGECLWAATGRGNELVAGGTGGLTWWDARSGQVTRSVPGVRVMGSALAWHPTSSRLVVGSWSDGGGGGVVKVWDCTAGKVSHTLHADTYNTLVQGVAWFSRDHVLIGGTQPHLLRVTSLQNTTVGAVRGLRSGVWAVDCGRGQYGGAKMVAAVGSLLYVIELARCPYQKTMIVGITSTMTSDSVHGNNIATKKR
ncbi:uncharacterized protein LOC143025944 [Oratosquilla oratoria]|uniref:uncharacterized protein LOC143025944 n=1 Tax=Oratosquilla oratoria TaxID=337810 RepID=UPI003F7694AC